MQPSKRHRKTGQGIPTLPGIFTPQNWARSGFCSGFSHSKRRGEKAKNPVLIENTRFFMELLPGFEPGTSSLPIEPSLIFLVFACCILMPQSIDIAGFFFFACFILLPLSVTFCSGFYAVRSGFCSGVTAGARAGESVAEEAKAKQSAAGGDKRSEAYRETASIKIDKSVSEPINTQKEIAKLAGVSTGTGYDRPNSSYFEKSQKRDFLRYIVCKNCAKLTKKRRFASRKAQKMSDYESIMHRKTS